jgi:hypothetical protein
MSLGRFCFSTDTALGRAFLLRVPLWRESGPSIVAGCRLAGLVLLDFFAGNVKTGVGGGTPA